MSRDKKILAELQKLRGSPYGLTAAELCQSIGEPLAKCRFISSVLGRHMRNGLVTIVQKRTCTITNRDVNSYALRAWPHTQPKATRQPRKARQPKPVNSPRKARQPKAKPAPKPRQPRKPRHWRNSPSKMQPPSPKMTPEQIKAERRRQIIEEDMKRRQQKLLLMSHAEKVNRSKIEFQKLTGYHGADLGLMKTAYRDAARKYHPDMTGGSSDTFCKLNDAYQTLQNEYNK